MCVCARAHARSWAGGWLGGWIIAHVITSLMLYSVWCNLLLKYFYSHIHLGLTATILPSSSSAVMVNTSPLQSSLTPVLQLPSMEYNQKNFSVVSQPSSLVSIARDTHSTTSPVTTLSIVECLTTSNSVVTSISGQHVSTVTDIAGVKICICMHVHTYIST